MSDFLSMGGYGFYIWGAYLVTALLMVAEVVLVRRRRRRLMKRLARIGRQQTNTSSENRS